MVTVNVQICSGRCLTNAVNGSVVRRKQLEPLQRCTPTTDNSSNYPLNYATLDTREYKMQVSIDNQERAAKEKHLVALKNRLEELRAECAKIERECVRLQYELGHPSTPIRPRIQTATLDRVSASRTVQSTKFPIDRCPNEIFIHIFEYFLDGIYHRCIRRLILVCKRWHLLIMNTKSLWARIEIQDPRDLFNFSTKNSLVPYVNACFERSRDLTLDVKLDMGNLPTLNRYITTYLYECCRPIINWPDQHRFFDALDGVNWSCGSQWYEFQHEAVLNSLFGSNSEHLSRYRTLNLGLPYYANEAKVITETLAGPFPNLKYLHIDNIHHPFSFRFSSFPSAETIILTEIVPLKDLIASSTSLRYLEIGVDSDLSNIAELSSFIQLRRLALYFYGIKPADNGIRPVTVNLPHLHELIVAGRYPPLHGIDFNLPRLELLEFELETPFISLSKLHPRHIVLRIDSEDMDGVSKEEKEAMVRDIVTLSTTTQSVTFPDLFTESLGMVLAECRKKNAIPLLTQVTLVSEQGNEETFNPHDDTELAEINQGSP